MKKLSICLALAAAALGFSSCEQDRDPVLQTPTAGSFVLNVPEMANQYIDLQNTDYVDLLCSQPDYGYSAVAQYAAQVSLTEDFAEYRDIENAAPTSTHIQLKATDIAVALCELNGFTDESNYVDLPAGKVYFRATCELSGVEGTSVTSNVVAYNSIKGYFAIPQPGFIYLVGAPEGWAGPTESNAEHYADWRLFEPAAAIGSKVYTGVFNVPAGSAMFRFYTALTGWDDDSYGSQADDNPLDYQFENGSFSGTIVKGKGSFNFPDWAGGDMTITVDMSDMGNITITILEGSHEVGVSNHIYLVGAPEGWVGPEEANADHYAAWRLSDSSDNHVFTGSFDIPAGNAMFRFYTALTGWDADSYGSQVDDAAVDIALSNGAYSGALVKGKGSFNIPDWEGGVLGMSVDMNQMTVAFEAK